MKNKFTNLKKILLSKFLSKSDALHILIKAVFLNVIFVGRNKILVKDI